MEKQYYSYEEVLEALRQTPKGFKRAEILKNPQNRNLVLSSGANVTLFSGKVGEGASIKQRLRNVYVGLVERLNAKTAKPEGVGGLGGLSERTDSTEFHCLDIEQRLSLINLKDDVILDEFNYPFLTSDINVIRKNNVLRETFEELGNLGIYDFKIDPDKMKLIEMPGVKDDNFVVNVWNGSGNVWAITPFSHTLEVDETVLDTLHNNSIRNRHENYSEAKSYLKIPLFEALPRWGKKTGKSLSEDGRDMTYDYRYPHEWLVSWKIASELLHHNDQDLIKLVTETQSSVSHKIDFAEALSRMGQDSVWASEVLGVKPETITKMVEAADNAYRHKIFQIADIRKNNEVSGM